MHAIPVPTMFVEPVSPRREDPVPFYGQTQEELVNELLINGWRVDSSQPIGVIFVGNDDGVILALWTIEAMNARTATRQHTGIDLYFDPSTEWVQVI